MKSVLFFSFILLFTSCYDDESFDSQAMKELPREYQRIAMVVPHPDDEIFLAGGAMQLWLDQGREIRFLFVSDGRAAYTWARENQAFAPGVDPNGPEVSISQEELAEIRMDEVDLVMEHFSVPKDNYVKFYLPDQGLQDNIYQGSQALIPHLEWADGVVLYPQNDEHVDHRACYAMVVQALQELGRPEIRFIVPKTYLLDFWPEADQRLSISVPSYTQANRRALELYESQKYLDCVWSNYDYVENRVIERYSFLGPEDMGESAYF